MALLEQVDDPFAHPDPHRVLTRRTALVADELGEDTARVRAWAVARHIEYVLWSVDEDENLSGSIRMTGRARTLADVAGLRPCLRPLTGRPRGPPRKTNPEK